MASHLRMFFSKKNIKKISVVVFCLAVSFFLFVLFFLRNPHRDIKIDENLILSPCDGRIMSIKNKETGGTQVHVFLSLLDVHRFRVPVSGEVIKIEYNKGKFFKAYEEKAVKENEANKITFRMDNGGIIEITQIAGAIGRRIHCDLKEGDIVRQGSLFGLITFGSGCLIDLPSGYNLSVDLKDKVRAGQTVIAETENNNVE